MTKAEFIEKYEHYFADKWAYPEIGEGWIGLIANVMGIIDYKLENIKKYNDGWLENKHIDEEEHEVNELLVKNFKIRQIKEKFGGLRFYCEGTTKHMQGAIQFIEDWSYKICEECGTNQHVGKSGPWVRTICQPCSLKNENCKTWTVNIEKKVK